MRSSDSWLLILNALWSIHQYEKNFSTGEVMGATRAPKGRTLRVLRTCEKAKLIVKMPTGYRKRFWSFTKKFPSSLKELIEIYETHMVLQRAFKRRSYGQK